jgi:mRNA interferase RelE/StbE
MRSPSGSACELAQYRLRVDDVRVFYDVANSTVEILAVVSKAEADTWLARNAKPG